MTNEEIIRMAREAGLVMYDYSDPSLERFANLVAAEEREACANVAENIGVYDRDEPEISIAAAIRARGQG